MSTDWNIKCLDCGDVHGFDDANHEEALMVLLCEHAKALGGLAPLLSRFARHSTDVELRTPYGRIDAAWFAKHAGHRLCPIDEYGALLGQCAKYVICVCGRSERCKLEHLHEGDCSAIARSS